MKNIIKLTESELISIIKRTMNEEDSEYYEISASDYKQLLASTGYNAVGIAKLKRFGGKPIKVIGKLDISNTPINNLGTLYVQGALDVAHTKIKDLNNVTATGYVSTWGTPLEKRLAQQKKREQLDEAQERREDGDWDLDNSSIDSEGEMANAVFQFLIEDGHIDELSENEKIEYKELKNRLEEIGVQMEESDGGDDYDKLSAEFDDVQEDLDDLESKNNDVYGLIPEGDHYGLATFITMYDDIEMTIAVGTERDADRSLQDYMENLIDDVGYDGISEWVIESNINGEEVADYFEEGFRDDIMEDPDNYDLTKELSRQQENEIQMLELEKYAIEEYGLRLPIIGEKMINGEMVFYNYDRSITFKMKYDNSWKLYKNDILVTPGDLYDDEAYDEENDEEEREERIVEIDDEIEGIKEDPDGDPDENEVERLVDEKKSDVSDDPMRWIKDYGMDIKNFIDRNGVIDDLVSDASYGSLSGYDDTYSEHDVNGTTYIVIRTE